MSDFIIGFGIRLDVLFVERDSDTDISYFIGLFILFSVQVKGVISLKFIIFLCIYSNQEIVY